MAKRPQPRVDVLGHVLALLAGLEQRIRSILDERDRRYQERYEAQVKALDAAFLAADKAVQAALSSAKEAVIKAETAAERRFESVNEFRAQLADQAQTFMPRSEAETRLASLAEKLDDLKGSSKAGASALWGYLVGAVGVVLTIAAFVTR
jgi:hypothetical protein